MTDCKLGRDCKWVFAGTTFGMAASIGGVPPPVDKARRQTLLSPPDIGDNIEIETDKCQWCHGVVTQAYLAGFDMRLTDSGSTLMTLRNCEVYVAFWTSTPGSCGIFDYNLGPAEVKIEGPSGRAWKAQHLRLTVIQAPVVTTKTTQKIVPVEDLAKGGFVSHRFPLKATTDPDSSPGLEPCDYCTGLGRYMPFFGEEKECHICNGTGKVQP